MHGILPVILILAAAFGLGACSSARKKADLEISELRGKKIAFVEIEGEGTARSVVEVALVNQLIQRGSFILISKQDLAEARSRPSQDPRDWLGIAKNAGADYALRAKVLRFDSTVREGYSKETVEDSQLAAERGEEERETERLYRVKSMTGSVQIRLDFSRIADQSIQSGIAEAEEKLEEDERRGAIHFPPTLRFLERLANRALQDFFERH